jgi:hypothetical protein
MLSHIMSVAQTVPGIIYIFSLRRMIFVGACAFITDSTLHTSRGAKHDWVNEYTPVEFKSLDWEFPLLLTK